MWPETIQVLREARKLRPAPESEDHKDLVFLRKKGRPWGNTKSHDPLSEAFARLTKKLKIHRPGLGFYGLRHSFETIAGDSRDQVAVNHIMGHADQSMAGVYRERISDERLQAVVDHVHKWLFRTETNK